MNVGRGDLAVGDLIDGFGNGLFGQVDPLQLGVLRDLTGAARDHVDQQVTVGDILGEGVHSGIEHHSRILPFAAARHD